MEQLITRAVEKNVVQTRAVNAYLEDDESHERAAYVMGRLMLHFGGDDMGVCKADAGQNIWGRENEGRVMNTFTFPDCKRVFWIITEPWGNKEHEITTVLFPEDY